jgi:DNA adenine methylase
MDRFPDDEQTKLASVARSLDALGCIVMIYNADTPAIRRLYKGFTIHKLSATRYVTCKSSKHRVGEVVITNYS